MVPLPWSLDHKKLEKDNPAENMEGLMSIDVNDGELFFLIFFSYLVLGVAIHFCRGEQDQGHI